MADRYKVTNNDSWNGTAGSKWSTTSGGAGGAAEPTAADDVFFDGSTPAGTTTIDTVVAKCRSFNATGYTGTLHFSERNPIMQVGDGTVGHFTLGSGMTLTVAAGAQYIELVFLSTTGTNNITTNGITIPCKMTFDGVGGTWQFQDAVTVTSTGMFANVNIQNGTLDTNGKSVTAPAFSSAAGTTLTLGATTFTLVLDDGTVWSFSATATLTANTSTISITDIGSAQKAFSGGGKTYGTLNITGGGTGVILIQGSNTFTNFPQITGGTKNLRFTAATTQTFTGGTSFGNGANLVTIDTQTAGSAATLSRASGEVSCTSLSLKDNTATGGATWYAGATPPSVNVSGNTGWTFSAPPVLGGGNGVQQNSILLGVG